MRTVAERRFADAECLRKTGANERANGAMYLGGFAIECLLKARLLEKYAWLQTARDMSKCTLDEKHLFSLCYRLHHLAEMLERLPELTERLLKLDGSGRLLKNLRSLCAQWTIYVRYSPRQAEMREAEDFLDQVKELKECLKR